MNVQIESSWKAHLGAEFEKEYFERLTQTVRTEYAAGPCYPPGRFIFNAFNLCPFDKGKVVIIGQDSRRYRTIWALPSPPRAI